MGKLIDIPYSKLKENKRAYEIMLLRDLYDNTFTAIAQEYGVSVATITSNYYRVKIRQLRFYINNLAIVNGHESAAEFRELLHKVYDCYQDYRYVTAYFEKEYKDVLSKYRAGEPGLPDSFLATLPPFKEKWSKYIVSRVVKMREEKLSFLAIGIKLKMTQEKARDIYEWFYHKQWLAARDKVRETYFDGKDDLDNLRDYYKKYRTAKKRLAAIMSDYPDLFK